MSTPVRIAVRLWIWVILLSIGGCGGSKPDPKAAAEAICAAAKVPPPDSASDAVREAHAAMLAFCEARNTLEKDGGG